MTSPQLIGSATILFVQDVVASANYYRDQVGFSYEILWGDPPAFCILSRDNCRLMLSYVGDPDLINPRHTVANNVWDVYFWVKDAAALFDELEKRGAVIDYQLLDKPYGCREFGIRDLDGYTLAFGQELAAAKTGRD